MERYEIGHPENGVYCYCDSMEEAKRVAKAYGPFTTIYDRLAHYGAWQLWHVSDVSPFEVHAIERRPVKA
jgi:hypothetical protein